MGRPTCRGCGVGFICGGVGVANTTEGGCPGGNEGCKRQEVISAAEEWDAGGIWSEWDEQKKSAQALRLKFVFRLFCFFSYYLHLFIFTLMGADKGHTS